MKLGTHRTDTACAVQTVRTHTTSTVQTVHTHTTSTVLNALTQYMYSTDHTHHLGLTP